MASLRDQLVHALDLDPPPGGLGWLRSGPLDQALKVARGREPDALRELDAILADPASPARLRRNAVPVLTQLHAGVAKIPSAEEIYDARQRGEPFDPHAGLTRAMTKLLADADLEVRVAAAVELLQIVNPGDLPALRAQLAPLLPRLRDRRGESPEVQHALLALGGAGDTLTRLSEVAAGGGPLPPDLEVLLAAVARDPDPAAAPLLARLFPRLDAIAERRDPVPAVIGGSIAAWDGATNQVLLVFDLHVRLVTPAGISTSVELLRAATPAMAAVLVAALGERADRGVAVAGAAALDATLPAQVRRAAIAALAGLARSPTTPVGLAAIAGLQLVRRDPAVGGDAERALAAIGATRS